MKKQHTASIEPLEPRTVFAASSLALGSLLTGLPRSSYSIDGSGNNLTNSDWGSVGVQLLRLAEAAYADGLSDPSGADRPSAREISNALVDAGGEDLISDRQLSAMIYVWGQFIDHDLSHTPNGSAAEVFDVPVPQWDPSFDPTGRGDQYLAFKRSVYDETTGTTNAREQINTLTAWLDGSMIYGSDAATAASLRTLVGGLLKTSGDDLLPVKVNSQSFVAGDSRVNENIELTAMHTLFMREHNYWATAIAARDPSLSDDQIFEQARSIVIAEVQSITFNQWLPALLGSGAIDRYRGYDPTVNPGISNEFSTAAFRLGHSLLGDDVEFLDDNGNEVAEEIPLSQAFLNPSVVHEQGIDGILKYLASDPASELDTKIVDSVRNFLFGAPGAGGLDLASLNIQRGRDHGLPDFNSVRQAIGLRPVTRFAQITSDPEVRAELREMYGSVDNIDLWVGLLAEDHARGSSVGPTLQAIVSEQFERLRDGDRFWYQNVFSGRALRQIENTTLTDVLRRNTDLSNFQDNVFFFRATVAGTVFSDADRDGRMDRGERGMAGQIVQLLDGEGELLAEMTTDFNGRYRFDVDDGLRTGEYEIRTANARGTISRTVEITAGDDFSIGLNLGVVRLRVGLPR